MPVTVYDFTKDDALQELRQSIDDLHVEIQALHLRLGEAVVVKP